MVSKPMSQFSGARPFPGRGEYRFAFQFRYSELSVRN